MSDCRFDPELQQHFADVRRANAEKLKLQQEREEKLREEVAATAKRREDEQKRQRAAKLESDLRAAFFRANPTATGEDYERLAPTLRDRAMLDAAAPATANVYDRIRDEARERKNLILDGEARLARLETR